MKKSRIPAPVSHVESPLRPLPLVDLLVDTRTELLELALRSGLEVFTAMREEDRTTSCGISKSAVRRRFVARTTAQLADWQSAPLDGLDLVAPLIDGVHLCDRCLIVALGIAADGQKHALALWDGSTENATVCQGPAGESPESRPRHGREPARDPRWLRRRSARPCA